MRRLLGALAAFCLLFLAGSQAVAHGKPDILYPDDKAQVHNNEVLVKFTVGVQAVTPFGSNTEPLREWPAIHKVTGLPTSDMLSFFATQAGVEWAAPNYLAYAQQDPVDIGEPWSSESEAGIAATTNDQYLDQQYSLDAMDVFEAWDRSRGDGVVIGIVDSGATFNHADLAGKFVSRGRDYINNDDDASDDQGHGTHVAGIAAAATNNTIGIAGVGYNARFLMCKGLSAGGSGPLDAVSNCVKWLADQPNVKIINMSLGCACPHPIHAEYVNYAWNKGILVVAAAGNSNEGVTRFYPAAEPNALAVGATNRNNQKASFSNYGPNVDVMAPGEGILSTVRTGGYESWNGTSMAAPNASGVAALVAAANPGISAAALRAKLENTTTDLGPAGRDNIYGLGLLNAARAVGSSVAPTVTPGPSVTPRPTNPPSNDFTAEVERLINERRAEHGLPPLRIDRRLGDAAAFHNDWMARNGCFSHNCPNEPPPLTRMRNAGYPAVSGGENIAAGYTSPLATVNAWMNSPGHRAAILNTTWPDLGCHYLAAPNTYYRHYWTCNFARSNEGPPPTPRPTFQPSPAPSATMTQQPTVLPPTATVVTPTVEPTRVLPPRTPTVSITAQPRRLSLVVVDGNAPLDVRTRMADLGRKWRGQGVNYWTVQDQPAADQYAQLYAYTSAGARSEFEAFCAQYRGTGVECRYE